jgi:ornithine carbamoyltransferase
MADMLHLINHFGGVENLKGKKIAMTWAYPFLRQTPVGAPGVIGLMTRFGMEVVLAHPEGYEVMPEVERWPGATRPARRQFHQDPLHGRGL